MLYDRDYILLTERAAFDCRRVVGLQQPDLTQHMVEFEAVRQPSETIAENTDLAVNAGQKLLGGGATPWHAIPTLSLIQRFRRNSRRAVALVGASITAHTDATLSDDPVAGDRSDKCRSRARG